MRQQSEASSRKKFSRCFTGLNTIYSKSNRIEQEFVDYVYDNEFNPTSINRSVYVTSLNSVFMPGMNRIDLIEEFIAHKMETYINTSFNESKMTVPSNISEKHINQIETEINDMIEKMDEIKMNSVYSIACNQTTYDTYLQFADSLKNKNLIVFNSYINVGEIYVIRNNSVEFKNDISGIYFIYNDNNYDIACFGMYPHLHISRLKIKKSSLPHFESIDEKFVLEPIFKSLFNFKIDVKSKFKNHEEKIIKHEIESQVSSINNCAIDRFLEVSFNINLDENKKIIPLESLKCLLNSSEFDVIIEKRDKDDYVFARVTYKNCKLYDDVGLKIDDAIDYVIFNDFFNVNISSNEIETLNVRLKYDRAEIRSLSKN